MADFAAWFRREDYERIREIMEDSDRLPPSFDEWELLAKSRVPSAEFISQSRLGGPGLSRSRRRLSALKRRISSSSALFFSSRMVMRDLGSSLPRNLSSAFPTSSFSVIYKAPRLSIVADLIDPKG